MTCCRRLTKYSNKCQVSAASFKYIKNGMNQDNDTLVLGLFETLLWHVSIDSDPGWQEKSSQWIHLVPALDARAQTSNTRHTSHFVTRHLNRLWKLMKSGKHAMATLEPTTTTKLATLIDYLLDVQTMLVGHSLQGRRSCMKSTFKCWQCQYGIIFFE